MDNPFTQDTDHNLEGQKWALETFCIPETHPAHGLVYNLDHEKTGAWVAEQLRDRGIAFSSQENIYRRVPDGVGRYERIKDDDLATASNAIITEVADALRELTLVPGCALTLEDLTAGNLHKIRRDWRNGANTWGAMGTRTITEGDKARGAVVKAMSTHGNATISPPENVIPFEDGVLEWHDRESLRLADDDVLMIRFIGGPGRDGSSNASNGAGGGNAGGRGGGVALLREYNEDDRFTNWLPLRFMSGAQESWETLHVDTWDYDEETEVATKGYIDVGAKVDVRTLVETPWTKYVETLVDPAHLAACRALFVEGLTIRLKEHAALLCGPSGSGKTTMLQAYLKLFGGRHATHSMQHSVGSAKKFFSGERHESDLLGFVGKSAVDLGDFASGASIKFRDLLELYVSCGRASLRAHNMRKDNHQPVTVFATLFACANVVDGLTGEVHDDRPDERRVAGIICDGEVTPEMQRACRTYEPGVNDVLWLLESWAPETFVLPERCPERDTFADYIQAQEISRGAEDDMYSPERLWKTSGLMITNNPEDVVDLGDVVAGIMAREAFGNFPGTSGPAIRELIKYCKANHLDITKEVARGNYRRETGRRTRWTVRGVTRQNNLPND